LSACRPGRCPSARPPWITSRIPLPPQTCESPWPGMNHGSGPSRDPAMPAQPHQMSQSCNCPQNPCTSL
jgi:hypothetical protein